MALFNNGDLEEFMLFVQNFNMTLAASGTLAMGVKIQYICTLVRLEALHQFDLLSADVEGTNPLTTKNIILGLASYFFPVNSLSKKNRAMRHGTRNPRGLKVIQYSARLIDLNEYLASLPGATL